MSVKLDKIFDSVAQSQIFKNKSVLQSNYIPEHISHRDEQIEKVASILASSLKGEKPSNLFVYGATGTGKTLCVRYVLDEIMKRVSSNGSDFLKVVYINCKLKKVADTEYRILAEIISNLGGNVPATGLPTESVYSKFVDLIDDKKKLILIVLDEIDQAVKKISDGFLYTLTRLNSELKNSQISLVGISNNLTFMDEIDPRVRSSLGEEEEIFPPYNAIQLQEILKKRSAEAFYDNSLGEGVMAKCGALAARENGDARRSLDLLRVAGELAERSDSKSVDMKHVDEAVKKIERDKMLDVIENEPSQFKAVLLAIMYLAKDRPNNPLFTGDIYNRYQDICKELKTEALTQRRISDILAEFDMLGIINATVISKGRQGRTREIKLMIPQGIEQRAKKLIEESLGL